MKRLFCAVAVLLLSAGGGASGAVSSSFDATVDSVFHGFLIVKAADCHTHQLVDSNRLPQEAILAWGSGHYNVHIKSRVDGSGLEEAEEIYPRAGRSFLARCAEENQTFRTHIDGVIVSWTEGQAIGTFDVVTGSGSRRSFTFLAGKEPKINGATYSCLNAPDIACAGFSRLITLNMTRIRVYYNVVESADGPSNEVVSIETR